MTIKKAVSILLAAVLFLGGLVGCESRRKGTTVTLPAADAQRMAMEQAGAMATRLFVLANLKTDALLEYDINSGSMEELKALTADALETWRLCDVASARTMQLVDYAQELRVQATTQAARMLYADRGGPSFSLFSTVAYAAEENAAVKWARELTEKYDSYPAGQKVKQLAENLGTDAKKAYAQLKMAQNILTGEAYSAEGDTMQKFENAAIAAKTACKTGLYIGGVVAGGGLSIDEVVGTYNVKRVDIEEEFLVKITKSGNGQLSYDDDLIFDYDQNTGIATCSYKNEAGRGTADLMFTFKDGKIHLSIYWVYTNEEIDKTYIMESKEIKIN